MIDYQQRQVLCHQLRQQVRHARKQLSPENQQTAATQAKQQFLVLLEQLQQHIQINRIALFLSFDGELNTRPLIDALWQKNIQTCLPIIHPFAPQNLLFFNYEANTSLHLNKFNIAEPKLDIRQLILLDNIDLIVTPLVAFDNNKNRMGMGGGFYDRTLAQLKAKNRQSVITVGFAHDCQQVDNIPTAPWDEPLTMVVTPSNLFK